MYTLFKVMTMETWADIARHTASFYEGAEIFFVLYIFCTSLFAAGPQCEVFGISSLRTAEVLQ